jgi:ribbon-helix-helix CopG family protein
MKSTTRLQIELPKASMERLKALKEKTEAISYAEVVRDAFKLYERMIEYVESGSVVMIRDKEGNTREIELFY